METGAEGLVDAYPSPQELWDATFAKANALARPLRRRTL